MNFISSFFRGFICTQLLVSCGGFFPALNGNDTPKFVFMNQWPGYCISRNFSEDLILALLVRLFSLLKLCIANNTSHLEIIINKNR